MKGRALVFICLLAAGCGDTAARQLASDTVRSVDAYQGEVNKKVQAESNFYVVEKANIQERVFGCPSCTPSVAVNDSLYYNDLVVSTQHDSLILAEQFVENPNKGIASGTVNFISSGLAGETQLYGTMMTRQEELDLELNQGIAKLQSPTAELGTVRTQAALLATKPGTASQLSSLYQLGSGVAQILQKISASK